MGETCLDCMVGCNWRQSLRGAATFCLAVCFGGMKQFLLISLKVLMAAVVGVAIVHFWPLTILPVILGLLVGLGLLVLSVVSLVAIGAVGGGMVIGLLGVALALLALLSPVWIPAALLLGMIWLVKKLSRTRPRPPVGA